MPDTAYDALPDARPAPTPAPTAPAGTNAPGVTGGYDALPDAAANPQEEPEIAIFVDLDGSGRQTKIPALVPGLTDEEREHLAAGGAPTESITAKATAQARERMARGLGPYKTPYENLPDSTESIVDKIDGDPFYMPSREEFRVYRKYHAERPKEVGKAAADAASHILKSAWELTKAGGKTTVTASELTKLQTVLEGVSRGTVDTGILARTGMDKLAPMFEDDYEDWFIQQKANDANWSEHEARLAALSSGEAPPGPPSEPLLPGVNVPDPLMAQWRKEFQEYKLDRDFGRFELTRDIGRMREIAKRGQGDIAPHIFGEPDQATAEALSQFTDATDVASFGSSFLTKQLLRQAARRAAASAARRAGEAAAHGSRVLTASGRFPEEVAKAGARVMGMTEAGAERVGKVVAGGQAAATVLPGVGVHVPGVTEVAAAATAAKVGGRTLGAVGEALQAAGRAAESQSRLGLFERISRDPKAPAWLQKAAVNAMALDPAMKTAAGTAYEALRGAAIGGTVGGGVGYVLSGGDPEAAGSGFGSGGVIGAHGALVERVRSRKARAEAEIEADLARWLAGKTPEEISNIAKLRLTRAQALKVADIERWARGADNGMGGDIQIRYLNDADFRKLFDSSERGAEIVMGDQPTVFINTQYRGPRSMFHEVFHAVEDLDAFSPQREQLNKQLFSEVAADGTVIRKGAFDPADVAAMEKNYRERLSDVNREKWDKLTDEQRQARIKKEIRAESFANMVEGSSGRDILKGASGWRRRLADSLLLADHVSTLGRMRQALESIGVEFKASGEPSDIFFHDGKPLTNQPEVDAALRDYMRAKRKITERLTAGDEVDAAVTFDESAMRGNPELASRLADLYPDWDGWARNPDGTIKRSGGAADVGVKTAAAVTAQNRVASAEAEMAKQEARRAKLEQRAAEAEAHAAEAAKAAKTEVERAQAKLETAQAKQARLDAKAAEERAAQFRRQVAETKREAKARADEVTAAHLSPSRPVLATEAEIKRLQTRRVEGMMDALSKVADDGTPGAVRLQKNGHWTGRRFTEAQLRALHALPDDVLSPRLKENLRMLNDLAGQPGRQMVLDYNAALRGGRYSSGISPTTRIAVPIGMDISKAGNFVMTTLDVGHFIRKLNNWRRNKPGAFEPWGGDQDAFLADVMKYLDNHQRGLPGHTDLDLDAGAAIKKRDVIKDLFNIGGPEALLRTGGEPLSTKSGKDNLIRARRLDRINRVSAGEGTPFPIDYQKQQINFLPKQGTPEFNRYVDDRIEKSLAYPEAYPLEFLKDDKGNYRADKQGQAMPLERKYDFENSKLAQETRGRDAAESDDNFTSALADRIEREYHKLKQNPAMAEGEKWYEAVRAVLQKYMGPDSKMFAELLGATSPNTKVGVNFGFALEAINQFRSGAFDDMIKKYREGKEIWARKDAATIEKFVADRKRGKKGKKVDLGERAFLNWWRDKHNLIPKQSSGAKFGMNSEAVLRVLDGSWLDTVKGPKTPNFNGNMIGTTFEATIDIWAARTLLRLANEGKPVWRIQAANKGHVTDADFFMGQRAFRKAADRLGIQPDALQGIIWFGEKELWDKNGWQKADLGDYGSLFQRLTEDPVTRRLTLTPLPPKPKAPKAPKPAKAPAPAKPPKPKPK